MKLSSEELIKELSIVEGEKGGIRIFQFAYLGKPEQTEEKFQNLAQLAEDEVWTIHKNLDLLKNYIYFTFEKLFDDNEIIFSDDRKFCCFNTGLLTKNGEDIICVFNEFIGSDKFKWHLSDFKQASSRELMNNFYETPKVANYFQDADNFYFDPSKEMLSNLDHILDENFERFSDELREKGKKYILALLESSLNLTLKKCKRNYRIAVPQYYNKKIMHLLPIELDGHSMALAVELVNNRYRANTIFTLDMAYKNARLLMKPEADWLEIRKGAN